MFFFWSKQWHKTKKKKKRIISQKLSGHNDPDVHCKHTDAGLVIFSRAAGVSRVHRAWLAKRERM